MAIRVIAHLAVFLGMALCCSAESFTCLGGIRLSCTPDNCNNTFTPLWIQPCEEDQYSCFNATAKYTLNDIEYTSSVFGCAASEDTEDSCSDERTRLEMILPEAAAAFTREEAERRVTIDTVEHCICTRENCNGYLQPRDLADTNNRAEATIWPIMVLAIILTIVLIVIGASVSLCT